MKLEKIELQTKEGDYVLCTIYIDVAWDVDEYAFQVEAVTVKGVSYPELMEVAEEWIANNEKLLVRDAMEDARQERIAWEESR
jgi:arginase family enzyme